MDTRLPAPGRLAGFTLLEALSTVSVGAILLSIAIPSFQHFVASNAMTAARNSMVTHLHLARSEAVKRNITAVLCPSLDGLGCLDSFDWKGGFMLFSDSNGNRIYDSGEQLLRFQAHDFGNIRVRTSTRRRRIAYHADGSARGYNATFTFCDETGQVPPRAILLSGTGRPRLADKGSKDKALDCGG